MTAQERQWFTSGGQQGSRVPELDLARVSACRRQATATQSSRIIVRNPPIPALS